MEKQGSKCKPCKTRNQARFLPAAGAAADGRIPFQHNMGIKYSHLWARTTCPSLLHLLKSRLQSGYPTTHHEDSTHSTDTSSTGSHVVQSHVGQLPAVAVVAGVLAAVVVAAVAVVVFALVVAVAVPHLSNIALFDCSSACCSVNFPPSYCPKPSLSLC